MEEEIKNVQDDVKSIMGSKFTNKQKLGLLEAILYDKQKKLTDEDRECLENAIEEVKFALSEEFAEAFLQLREEYCENGGYLDEIHVLRRVVKLVSDRITDISADALQEGMDILNAEKPSRQSGAFEWNGRLFEISSKPVFDFVDHAPRYTMPEGVEYRVLYLEQQRLKELSKAKTQKMAAITKSFPIEHPDWVPDWTETILKCKDSLRVVDSKEKV